MCCDMTPEGLKWVCEILTQTHNPNIGMLGRTFNSRLDPSLGQHQGGGGVVGPQLPAVGSTGFHQGEIRVDFA
jgi:hypothetical protein